MNTNDNRQNAHNMIDHIFHDLLSARGMTERPEQISLSHLMLDAIVDGSIALCDAGTGIGKTYSYLAAGTAFLRFRADSGRKFRPILISTSSIALQNAVQREYLPFLSDVLMADGLLDQPLRAVIRKGKAHYVCDQRLERRLGQLDLSKKNWKAGRALLSLREQLDMDGVSHLSNYDKQRVSVPQVCDCGQDDCRYLAFLEDCAEGGFPFQICNHNLLLADAIHRGTGRSPILPDACAVIIDEAHKLPDAARQMFGTTLDARDIQALIRSLRREKFLLASEMLAELSAPLLRLMDQPFEDSRAFHSFARLLIAPTRNLHIIRKQLHGLLSAATYKQMKKLTATMELFTSENTDVVFYAMEDKRGGTMLCAVPADLNAQLRSTLWSQENSIVLTSGTLAVGQDFRRFKEEAGLLADGRVIESVAASPFDYKANCLLYLPLHPPEQDTSGYYDELAAEIAALLDACWGHALVLFTSYAAMSAIKERLAEMKLPWEIFTLGRNAVHTTQQFKDAPGSVLLATGAAWEGFDFPGDCVSLLVIPRLPFSRPDALKEKKGRNTQASAPISEPWWCRRCRSSSSRVSGGRSAPRPTPAWWPSWTSVPSQASGTTRPCGPLCRICWRRTAWRKWRSSSTVPKGRSISAMNTQAMFEDYPDVVEVTDLCRMLGGISRKLAYRLLADQEIKSVRIGRSYKIPKVCVIDYLTRDIEQ